jgi:hypothetical protein
MPQVFPNQLISDLEDALSSPRFGTYLRVTGGDRQRAAQLYSWNTEVSAAFYTPLQYAEIGTRNGAIEAITIEFGPNWHRSRGFQLTVRERIGRYLRPRRDLVNLANHHTSAGAVAAELKFAFWQHLFVTAQDRRLWEPHLRNAFPGIPATLSVASARQQIHDDIQAIRALRNRIAHHEPIIARALSDDLDRAHRLAKWRRPMLGAWLQQANHVAPLLNNRP